MTEFFVTSPNLTQFGGRKRCSSAFVTDEPIEPSHFAPPAGKRSRMFEERISDAGNQWPQATSPFRAQPSSSSSASPSCDFLQSTKRNRPAGDGQSQHHNQDNVRFGDSSSGISQATVSSSFAVMSAMQSEFSALLAQKDSEIAALRQRNVQLEGECHNIQASKRVQDEENKLLKRAVAIQDNRQKELASQNNQLQCVLGQAAQQMALLNQTNSQLKEIIENSQISYHNKMGGGGGGGGSGGGGFNNYGPPDVY